jgi:hypothetical protein
VRDPRLGAVEDVLVAVPDGAGGQRRGVGATGRLGEAVRAEQLAAEHVRQEPLALRVRCRTWRRVAGQRVHRDRLRHAQPTGREDLQDLQVHLVGLGAAAVLLGIGQAEQTGPAKGAQYVAGELAARLVVVNSRSQLTVGSSCVSSRRAAASSVGRIRSTVISTSLTLVQQCVG